MKSKIITKYFTDLNAQQLERFELLFSLYNDWNSQINVISRKDIDELYLKHILHSLAIAKVVDFKPGTQLLDVGTGGGFPGIPLAILYPNCQFYLVDSIGKKIKVVQEIANKLGLTNVIAQHKRAEEVTEQFDFIVTRAVTRISNFLPWVKGKVSSKNSNALKNGILFLKGGDVAEEIMESNKQAKIYSIANFFEEKFFETKVVVYMRMK